MVARSLRENKKDGVMAAAEQTCQSSRSGRTSLWEAGGGKRKRRKAGVGWRGEVRINIWHGERRCEESRSARSTNNVMIYYATIQTVTNTLKNQGASGELQHPRVFPPPPTSHTHTQRRRSREGRARFPEGIGGLQRRPLGRGRRGVRYWRVGGRRRADAAHLEHR